MIIVVSGKRLNSHSFLIKVFASLILFLSISNSQCSAFDIRCITCTLTQCTQCQNGYVVNALMTTCIECNVPNCLSCVNPNSCSSCIGNFSVNIFGGSCTLCRVPNCLNCNNINTCNQCEPGFIAKQDGTCSSNCTTANNLCLGCSSLNFCSDCPANAMLNGTNTPVTLFQGNCYFCSDPQCLICSSDQVCQNCNGTHLAIS